MRPISNSDLLMLTIDAYRDEPKLALSVLPGKRLRWLYRRGDEAGRREIAGGDELRAWLGEHIRLCRSWRLEIDYDALLRLDENMNDLVGLKDLHQFWYWIGAFEERARPPVLIGTGTALHKLSGCRNRKLSGRRNR